MLQIRKKGSEDTRPATSHAWSHRLLAPLLVLVLLGQFAPVGLLVTGDAAHECPHCNGAEMTQAVPHKMKCMHPAASNRHGKHEAMRGMHGSGQSTSDEPSFCGCGPNDSSLVVMPSIGKTMFVAESPAPRRAADDQRFGIIRASVGLVYVESPFHPPRPV